jgi:hypothetical protein
LRTPSHFFPCINLSLGGKSAPTARAVDSVVNQSFLSCVARSGLSTAILVVYNVDIQTLASSTVEVLEGIGIVKL